MFKTQRSSRAAAPFMCRSVEALLRCARCRCSHVRPLSTGHVAVIKLMQVCPASGSSLRFSVRVSLRAQEIFEECVRPVAEAITQQYCGRRERPPTSVISAEHLQLEPFTQGALAQQLSKTVRALLSAAPAHGACRVVVVSAHVQQPTGLCLRRLLWTQWTCSATTPHTH